MVITKPGGQCDFQFPGTQPDYFMIDPMDSFTITQGLLGIFLCPFLDVFPFSGNVYFSNPAMSLPLPPAGDAPADALVDRYQFRSRRFWLDNAWPEGMSADVNALGYYEDSASYSGVFNSLPGNPPYTVDYVKAGSIYWFSFSD